MKKQNVTLSLPDSLLKRAKALAAREHTSLSELMKRSLEEVVRDASGYQSAMNRQLRLLETGFDMGSGGRIRTSREELHER